ncbi:MAG TPA: YbaK/EbsC family protein [Anaerolineales bacterium]|nr:YbaK/EbsC family protein [Anaerolineales bacterium]
MRYRDLNIQTQREAPNNARTQGFAFLVRAGYLTRENEILPLGQQAIERLKNLAEKDGTSFFSRPSLSILNSDEETFFPISSGSIELIACPSCHYTARKELAIFKKIALPTEELLPLKKVYTPDCNTIESLANFLNIPKEKTAKALMFTRISDSKFIFIVMRGDMTLSEAKLKNAIGEVRLATPEEILAVGAVPGFASPVGLKNALIIVDELILASTNLVAGANEAGYHLLNTNSRRDYTPQLVLDLALAKAGDACIKCGKSLIEQNAELMATRSEIFFQNVILALAESYHDEKGLTLPFHAAPFDVYLMHVPGKEIDTRARAEEIYDSLQSAGLEVLFDDRDERAGVKFNDADLIGCPIRVTVGEKNLKEGMVELRPRNAKENRLISIENIAQEIQNQLK